ncbi:hypothetical protein SLA2020_399950 [Shorea laevis]
MTFRGKTDDQNEKIIRSLFKLPANRRCINCDSIGPQYVVTDFWTFVCSTCAGMHREFSHRVKSVSLATFSSEEVSALQKGGNKPAKDVFFKDWKPGRHSIPDNSNAERLRDFIKQVYVNRKYSGEKSCDSPSNAKMVDTGYFNTPEMDTFESHYIERSRSIERNREIIPMSDYGERRITRYGQESRRRDNYKKLSARFEVVDDRFRDHRSESRKLEDNCFPEMVAKQDVRPANHKMELDSSRPRVMRSLREMLNKIPTLRVTKPPEEVGDVVSDSSTQIQRTQSIGTRAGNSVELKRADSVEHKKASMGTPADIHADSKPAPHPQAKQLSSSTGQFITKSARSSIDNNWASFDSYTQGQGDQLEDASTTEITDSVSPKWLVPAVKTVGNTSNTAITRIMLPADVNTHTLSGNDVVSTSATSSNLSTPLLSGRSSAPEADPSGAQSPSHGTNNFLSKVNHLEPGQAIQQPKHSTTTDSTTRSTAQVVSGSPVARSSQTVSTKIDKTSSAAELQSPLPGKKSSTRELPEYFFTATYSPVPVPFPGWQPSQAHVMGSSLQYPSTMQVQAFSQPVTSRNPFDLNSQIHMVQSPGIFSMASLQEAPANAMSPRGLLQPSISPQGVLPQSSPYIAVPSHPIYKSEMSPSACSTGQQLTNQLPHPRYPGIGAFDNNRIVFSTLDASQQLNGGGFSAPTTFQRSFPSAGGNPFA